MAQESFDTSAGSSTSEQPCQRSNKVDSKQIFLIIGAVLVIVIFGLISKYSGGPKKIESQPSANDQAIDYSRYYNETGKNEIDDIYSIPSDTTEYKPDNASKKELINLDIQPKYKDRGYQENKELRAKKLQEFQLKQDASVAALEAKLPKKMGD